MKKEPYLRNENPDEMREVLYLEDKNLRNLSNNEHLKEIKINLENIIQRTVQKNLKELIEKGLENLLALQKILFLQLKDPKYFDEICLQKKFTFSQKVTLRKYLTQWQARFPQRNPLEEIGQRMTASQILKKFSDNLMR